MHDTDRIAMEYPTSYEGDESSYGFEDAFSGESGAGETGVFDELDEIDLASQLMEVSSDQELDNLLGNIFRKAASLAGTALKTPVGQALGGMLKGVVRKHAGSVGSALGGRIAGGAGARLGSQAASSLVSALGFETVEAGEDQEFAAARRFIRTAGSAATKAAQAVGIDPREAARRALVEAARKYLPGILGETGTGAAPAGPAAGARGAQSGRWIRRGSRIVLLGA